MRNKNKYINSSSKYRGVCWHKASNKWRAQIQINNKTKYLGLFDNEEDAYLAYKKVYDEIMDCIAQN